MAVWWLAESPLERLWVQFLLESELFSSGSAILKFVWCQPTLIKNLDALLSLTILVLE